MEQEIAAEIDAAVEEAEAHPQPDPGQLFEHVYVDPPSRMLRQRAELAAEAPGRTQP